MLTFEQCGYTPIPIIGVPYQACWLELELDREHVAAPPSCHQPDLREWERCAPVALPTYCSRPQRSMLRPSWAVVPAQAPALAGPRYSGIETRGVHHAHWLFPC